MIQNFIFSSLRVLEIDGSPCPIFLKVTAWDVMGYLLP